MKGPGIKDYTAELTRRREEAHAQGLKYIEVNSKKLHQEISPDFATMPTCCQAMYKQMLTGDEILELVEALEDHHGAVAYEAEGELVADILTSIADQGG